MNSCLLVTVDSLRADHVTERLTPTCMRLGDRGVSFDHAFATGPGTTPSFPALLTGTLPLSYGGLGPLTEDRPRVATRLAEAGLRTAGFQCNPFLSSQFNYDTGFERFEDYQNPLVGLATRLFPRGIELTTGPLERIDRYLHLTALIKRSYRLVKGKPRPYVSAEVVTDDAVAWLEEQTGPFFCWTHYMDVHHPCYPPSTYRDRFDVGHVTQSAVADWYAALLRAPETLTDDEIACLRGLYRASIAYVDDQIERLVRTLERTGRKDDTLVVVTADHGELFGEHDSYGKPERLYDELLKVPLLVVNGPSSLESATDELVSLLDIPPLVHDALGLAVPAVYDGQCPGVAPPREYVLAEHEVDGDVIVGARSKQWLYENDRITDQQRLYDLRDGFEAVPTDQLTQTAATRDLRDCVHDRLTTLDVDPTRLDDTLDGDIEDRLEDLGYL